MSVFIATLTALFFAASPQSEPVVPKAEISVHTVRRGDMRLRIAAIGSITSLNPARAVVTAPPNAAGFLAAGQSVSFEFQLRPAGGGALTVMSRKGICVEDRKYDR